VALGNVARVPGSDCRVEAHEARGGLAEPRHTFLDFGTVSAWRGRWPRGLSQCRRKAGPGPNDSHGTHQKGPDWGGPSHTRIPRWTGDSWHYDRRLAQVPG